MKQAHAILLGGLACSACTGPNLNLGDSDGAQGGNQSVQSQTSSAGQSASGAAGVGGTAASGSAGSSGGAASGGDAGSAGAIVALPLPRLEEIPFTGDDTFGSVYVGTDGSIWAGSSSVQRYAGGVWSGYTETTGETICDMWGDGPRPTIVSGQQRVYRYEGAWSPIGTLDCAASLRLSVTERYVYAACPDETDGVMRIARSDYATAEPASDLLLMSRTLWAFSDSNIQALVGYNDTKGRAGYLRVYGGGTWNAAGSWTQQEIERSTPPFAVLNAMWSTDGESLLVVGNGGTALRRQASGTWSQDSTGSSAALHDAWGSASDGEFAVGDNGTVLFHDRAKWHVLTSPATARLKAVHGQPGGTIVIVGESGTVLRVVR